jgi:hypothetical protein
MGCARKERDRARESKKGAVRHSTLMVRFEKSLAFEDVLHFVNTQAGARNLVSLLIIFSWAVLYYQGTRERIRLSL